MPRRQLAHPTLAAFLAHPGRPAGTLRYHEVQGFLFAVASAPDLVMPSEWMAVIFNDGEAMYDDLAQANAVLADLMAPYNEVTAATREDTAGLPAGVRAM